MDSSVTISTLPTSTVGSITVASTSATSFGTLTMPPTAIEDLLERYELNHITVDHKVAEHEMIRLKEVAPDYAKEIKENLSRNVAREIINKTSFTKKLDKDADVHHFIGRVWVFSDEELKKLIEEARRV
jgi:hypothetical protein